ncbi:hypothetical protein N44_03714 [Microcystis aeruginosa NIES-44]|uniref:Uncharacterized protein n=1 Tax=Microcystis aeruginosa NIES-44 TaxID=449439 RepID=A0A0A1VZ74_MICAE|nr:hypothetical protein N44_03714 [Microcystis aeruginosa NIES-44]
MKHIKPLTRSTGACINRYLGFAAKSFSWGWGVGCGVWGFMAGTF